MEILITNSKSLRSIQEEFKRSFPFLKIEFYKEYHLEGDGSPKNVKWNSSLSIGEVRKSIREGHLKIHKSLKVAELENEFSKIFGIHVQVFRKSGNLWIQTTKTDFWTLAHQNQVAQQSNEDFTEEIIDAKDRLDLE